MEKRKLKIIIAAVVAAVVVLAGCIGAYVVNKNNNEKEIITPGELLNILNETGIYDPVLPQIFFDEGNEITLRRTSVSEDGTVYVGFNVYIQDFDVTVAATLRDDVEKMKQMNVKPRISKYFFGVKDYIVDGVYVLHFYETDCSFVTYLSGANSYSYSIDECSVEEADKIINSIKQKTELS